MKQLKTCKIWLVMNKLDVLSEDFNIPQIKSDLRDFLQRNAIIAFRNQATDLINSWLN
jgi:hypothetical protein